jgi:hypothetical protein
LLSGTEKRAPEPSFLQGAAAWLRIFRHLHAGKCLSITMDSEQILTYPVWTIALLFSINNVSLREYSWCLKR